MPIDFFLRSLAADVENRAAAVLLLGSNSDGTLGARNVRERGRLVLAQDPETAAVAIMLLSVSRRRSLARGEMFLLGR